MENNAYRARMCLQNQLIKPEASISIVNVGHLNSCTVTVGDETGYEESESGVGLNGEKSVKVTLIGIMT